MVKRILIFLFFVGFFVILISSQGPSDIHLARYVQYQKGDCPPLATYCRCGLIRKQGKECLFQVVLEADGSEVPASRTYAATIECSEKCKNNDPPAHGEKSGAVILRGPRHPHVWPKLEPMYKGLIAKLKAYDKQFGGKQLMDPHAVRKAEESIIGVEKKIARILLDLCVGYFYRAVPENKRIPYESFNFTFEGHSSLGAPMETNVQFGARLFIYSDCFFNASYKPTPEVFCASILHEMYHWQQENYGGGSSEIENILYELACTEKMRWNSFYNWILGYNLASREYYNPQRNYWVPRFNKAWSGLDRAAKKKVAGWAWSRGGVKDSTSEDPSMRLLMYTRQGWFYDIWEKLYKATELRIIRPLFHPLYKKK